ncbi:MAG TPA: hypothetical protein VH744_11680 [Terriglobales bacterium]|jgi:hypothetical protein
MGGGAKIRWQSGKASFLMLFVLLAGQFSSELHELAVKHAVCPNHDDLIETRSPDLGSSSSSAPTLVADSAGSGGHQHHHCLLTRAGAGTALRSVARVVQYDTRLGLLSGRLATRIASSQVPILLSAPKTSPPAAA